MDDCHTRYATWRTGPLEANVTHRFAVDGAVPHIAPSIILYHQIRMSILSVFV